MTFHPAVPTTSTPQRHAPVSDKDLQAYRRMIAQPSCAEEDLADLLGPLVARLDAAETKLNTAPKEYPNVPF